MLTALRTARVPWNHQAPWIALFVGPVLLLVAVTTGSPAALAVGLALVLAWAGPAVVTHALVARGFPLVAFLRLLAGVGLVLLAQHAADSVGEHQRGELRERGAKIVNAADQYRRLHDALPVTVDALIEDGLLDAPEADAVDAWGVPWRFVPVVHDGHHHLVAIPPLGERSLVYCFRDQLWRK